MYKIIAMDLDETLLNSDKRVSQLDIETTKKLNNTKLVLCTGRGYKDVQQVLKQIGYDNKPNEYVICFNGSAIVENKDNQVLYANYMPFEDAKMLFNIGWNYNVAMHVSTLNKIYLFRKTENEIREMTRGNFHYEACDADNIEFLKDEKICKVLFCNEDMEYLRKIRSSLNLDNDFSISYSSNRYFEFNPKNVNKGTGLKKLCEILDVDIKDTIGVGDNTNDLHLIQDAGLGICVKNAVKEILPYCDVILDATNNDNPLTEIYNKYVK